VNTHLLARPAFWLALASDLAALSYLTQAIHTMVTP
jgi:hypothetical protein